MKSIFFSLKTDEKKVLRTLFEASKVAGSTKYKQNTVWFYDVL